MTTLPDFRLEKYFSRWEFTARHHLSASDLQSMTLSDLLALADPQTRADWDNLWLGYTETYGLPALREAIAGTYAVAEAEDILCFAGAQEAIYVAMRVLVGAEDHAVVLTPNYQSTETLPLNRGQVTGVALRPEDGWALDVDAIAAALRQNTRVVAVNFPNNPTGAVADRLEFQRLVRLCEEREIHLFSDEVYRGLEADPALTLPTAVDLSERAISLGVMSKAYGLPGLRLGWIACRDRDLLGRLERTKHYTTICNSAPSEQLALIALRASAQILERNRALIARNTPVFADFFAEFADLFSWSPPQGGCVSFPQYHGGDGVEAMCAALVEQAGVLLVPASIFASALTPVPADRFRIGIGRADPEPALEAFRGWLRSRP